MRLLRPLFEVLIGNHLLDALFAIFPIHLTRLPPVHTSNNERLRMRS